MANPFKKKIKLERKEKKMKTWGSSKIYLVFIFSFTIIFNFLNFISSPQAWSAPEEGKAAKLIEGAKKEGMVVFYTTMTTDSNEAIRRAFEEKYPFVKMEVYRTNNPKLLAKVVTEARAGRHLWDVISIAGFQTYILKKQNFLARYASPEGIAVPKGFKDPEGYWASIYLNTLVLGYNTRLVSPKDIPQSYEDLLDPKWKGKMALDIKDAEWFANILKIMGEKKGLEFMKKLAEQNLRLMEGHTLQTQLMAAGEFPIGVNLYGYRVEEMKKEGAPVDWIPFEPVVTYLYPASISTNAPHSSGAKLLLDFLLSKEGQGIITKLGRIPVRLDVPPKSPRLVKGIKLWPSDLSMAEDYNKYFDQFQGIFYKGKK